MNARYEIPPSANQFVFPARHGNVNPSAKSVNSGRPQNQAGPRAGRHRSLGIHADLLTSRLRVGWRVMVYVAIAPIDSRGGEVDNARRGAA